MEKFFLAALPTRRQSEDFFQTLFDEAPMGIVIGDSDMRIVRANPRFCAMMGFSEAEMLGQTFRDFTHPDDVLKTEAAKATATREGRSSEVSYVKRFVRKDGEIMLGRITNSVIFREDGSILYTCGMVDDVTRQNELQRFRSQLASIVEFTSDAIISLNLDNSVRTWNQGAMKSYGYTGNDVICRNISFLFPEEEREQNPLLQAIEQVKESHNSVSLQTSHLTRHGAKMPVAVTLSPIMNEFNQIEAVSIISRDMSVYHHTLAQLHLSEQKAREASLHLARANRELEQFAFIASHDLQEPLRTICCYLQLFERKYKGQLDATSDEYLSFVVDAAKRMHNLILDLLHYSRTSKLRLSPRKVSLQEALEQVTKSLKPQIEEAGAVIKASNLPLLQYDHSQLVQLLQNLISNALKFRSDRPPVITIETQRDAKQWTISIHDNGIGFSEEYRDRIFLIFQRLHTKEEYPGTGVGLAICKKIVESHGGKIWADSIVGKGATFHFTIPTRPALEGGLCLN